MVGGQTHVPGRPAILFNSVVFLLFAAAFFSLWPWMRRTNNGRWVYLTVTSFVFYGWWDWRFLFLLAGCGLLNFLAVLGMAAMPRTRRLMLVISLLGSIGTLVAFKYSGFLAANADALAGWLGLGTNLGGSLPPLMAVLPVGISFYTFQAMSYAIDAYRGDVRPTRNVFHFFAYLSMFPQLVAGPIVRAADLLPQLETVPRATAEDRWQGLRLIVHGYFKKVVIADNLAHAVTISFEANEPASGTLYWWLAVSMFAFQIYCDFSGYSDIARGLAKWMGYEFRVNFDHPYVSTSLREFWSRWHISLSTLWRDYVYIPLGGSRRGAVRGHLNMWVAMVLSGFWHGASWSFVLWGALHSLYLSVERITRWPARLLRIPGGRLMATAVVLVLVWVAWVFFRADTLERAMFVLANMFSLRPSAELPETGALLFLGLAALREFYVAVRGDLRYDGTQPWRRTLDPVVLSLMLAACVYLRGPGAEFIYFQF